MKPDTVIAIVLIAAFVCAVGGLLWEAVRPRKIYETTRKQND